MKQVQSSPSSATRTTYLRLTSGSNCWRVAVLDGTGVATASLDGLDDPHRLGIAIGHGAEDDVLVVKPAGDDSGNEELGSVAAFRVSGTNRMEVWGRSNLRVGAGVSHGQEERLVVSQLEVLIRKLLAVDGLAAGALGKPLVSLI